MNEPYKPLHIGRASELMGRDYYLYRFFEMVPGLLAWGTIGGAIVFSYFAPIAVAIFIIIFDFFWLLKTVYLSMHLRQNWRRLKHNMEVNWRERIAHLKHEHLLHMVMLPYYNESKETVEASIQSYLEADYDHTKVALVLATEERAGEPAQEIAREMQEKYADQFGHFLITVHPGDIPGEMPGKGSNIAYAAECARTELLDAQEISYEDVIVSAFDVDTIVYPQYFACITYHFCTVEDPYRVSFQPVPLYNNNMWQAPALSRVVAASGTFWQMIQQERPEKLATFSSHSLSFQTLYKIGYWQKNMVSEDSRIYWNAFMGHDGDYRVVPIAYPVSMDANLAPKLWDTMKNIYKQQRRWGWGVENVPYILFNFVKNKKIALRTKVRVAFVQLEGFWSLATNPLLIFLLGWLPLVLGGDAFRSTVTAYILPDITRLIMTLAMAGLIVSGIISFSFLPQRPVGYSKRYYIYMALQWILVPVTITFFGSIPGLDAQTRLFLGRYMGFWVTPKERISA